MRVRFAAVLIVILITSGGGLPSPLAAAEVDDLIRKLDSKVYTDRELATEKLIEVGPPAIDAIGKAVRFGGPELAARGIFALREIALSDDLAIETAARGALGSLAADNSAVGRRARATLSELNLLRQSRAIERLKALGAKFENTHLQIGLQIIPQQTKIVINDDFEGTADDLRQISWIEDLDAVEFDGKKVTDKWVAPVGKIENLTSLSIKRANVTGAAFKEFKQMKSLGHLAIFYSPVGDASLEDIQKIGNLSNVQMFGTQVTTEAATKLATALPGTIIDHREGAFLGIGCDPAINGEGCQVTIVHPDSAAAAAGIRVGDMLTHFDGEAVTDFESLKDLIAKHRPGSNALVNWERGSEKFKEELELGEWD